MPRSADKILAVQSEKLSMGMTQFVAPVRYKKD
jgi:hypothetical protein